MRTLRHPDPRVEYVTGPQFSVCHGHGHSQVLKTVNLLCFIVWWECFAVLLFILKKEAKCEEDIRCKGYVPIFFVFSNSLDDGY